ncbi:hypothetical protein NFI96_007385, partial [Prochilodus magdalenae]
MAADEGAADEDPAETSVQPEAVKADEETSRHHKKPSQQLGDKGADVFSLQLKKNIFKELSLS